MKDKLRSALETMVSVDLRSLAALRISLGLLVIADTIGRLGSLGSHYSDDGVFPRFLLNRYDLADWQWSVYKLDGSSGFAAAVMVVTLIATIAMIAGYHTRVATVIVWVLLVSVQIRNPLVLSGADTLLRVIMFWAMLLPLGAVWSIDAKRTREVPAMRFVSLASAGYLVQIACMYWFTAALKSGTTWRSDFTALYYATGAEDIIRPFGRFLHDYPDLLKVLTLGSIGFEFAIPFLFFSPWKPDRFRTFAVFSTIAFHAGIWLMMDVGLFPFVSSLCMVALLPGSFWERVVPLARRRMGRDKEIRDAGTPLRSSPLLDAFAAVTLVLVVIWNVASVRDWTLPREVRAVGTVMAVDQQWSMFAPNPSRTTEWQLVGGVLGDFSSVNLLPALQEGDYTTSAPYSLEQPDNIVGTYYRDKYWRKYFEHLALPRATGERQAMADRLCTKWNVTHSGDERLQQVSLIQVSIRTLPDGERDEPKVSVVESFACAPQE